MASYLRNAREWATPTLKKTAFLSRGVLTPDEFVAAGDELVFKCPTWSWEGGDPKRAKPYLPADKQFLVTRGVPCQMRVSALENSVDDQDDTTCIDDECGGDDWLVSHILSADEQAKRRERELEETFDVIDDEGEVMDKVGDGMSKLAMVGGEGGRGVGRGAQEVEDDGDDDDEYADMADFEDNNVMADEAALATVATTSAPAAGVVPPDDGNLKRVRTYDLSITYDKYYQTPRVWIMGYTADAGSQPLTGDEMMQDVMSDYANRTVTIETHPHVASPHASIHPCQHGAVMKTIVRNLMREVDNEGEEGVNSGAGKGAKGPAVEMYLFIFLKFVSSMIPTINYDFTMDVTASTQK